ncbi:PTS sugar transporter subunit IIA [Kocuria sp.]|uniref:PTS sugar transporter subunit IIA n=1 Tax=Kocuria sp. TaxID=1871328 RepID=UPI0026DF0286|nr:PTS sugar transporter subunit IIA [Kocuria sp.]MDO5618071.1 PTS sugar transporter subunit IIA [Kocuria sp.]
MVTLHELATPDSIRLDAQAGDWRQAMQAAGDLLVAAGVSKDSYTESMIGNVEQHGPYIVIAPGIAFAHARANNDVHRTGMAWARLAEPVAFGHDSNDPVTLVAALAAKNSSAHIMATRQLATLLEDPQKRAALDTVGTPEEFLAVLR